MTQTKPGPLLPFESSFLRWAEQRGIRWDRLSFPATRRGEPTSGYRLTPGDPPHARVVAIHGAGNDSLFAWVGLFKELLSRGIAIFTFDLPGHGRANRTRFAAEDGVTAVQAAIAAAAGPDVPLHAIGVSLGGSVLLAALPDVQEQLATAALVVAPLQIQLSLRAIATELNPGAFALAWREREHYGLTGLVPSFGPFKRSIYPLRLAAPPGSGMFGYVETLNAVLAELRLVEAAGRVRVPSLLVYGKKDRIVPATDGERLAALIPRAELLLVPGGTHLSTPLDETVTKRLLQWVGAT
jgi:alpha-beta hydrolase superfamily lysophospholipase